MQGRVDLKLLAAYCHADGAESELVPCIHYCMQALSLAPSMDHDFTQDSTSTMHLKHTDSIH